MKRLLYSILFLSLLAGCDTDKLKTVHYYDAKGKEFDPPKNNRELRLELEQIARREHFFPMDIHVHTSLEPDFQPRLSRVLARLQDSIYRALVISDPDKAWYYDSLRRAGHFSEAAILVVDNETGRVLQYYSSEEWDGVLKKHFAGLMHKTFLFALAMQAEFRPSNLYPAMKREYIGDSMILVPDKSIKRTFRQAFAYRQSVILQGLNERYPPEDFRDFLRQLDMQPTYYQYDPRYGDYTISLWDITKAYVAFARKGEMHRLTQVDSVTDSRGHLLYEARHRPKQVLGTKTGREILQLLKAYGRRGQGTIVKHWFRDSTRFAGNFARFVPGNGSGWFIAISDQYTIGVYHSLYDRSSRFKQFHYREVAGFTVPLWIEAKKRK